MSQGPVASVPLGSSGGSSGNTGKDLKAVAAEIKSIQKDLLKLARDGKPLDRELTARFARAQDVQRDLKRIQLQDARIEGADRAAKVAKFLANSQSIRNIISGNAGFSDITSIVSSHKIENLMVKTFTKLGLAGFGASLARTLPIAGIVADVTKAGFDYLIEREKERGEAEKKFRKTFDAAELANISPALSASIRQDLTTEALFGAGINLEDPATRKRFQKLFPDVDLGDKKQREKLSKQLKYTDPDSAEGKSRIADLFLSSIEDINKAEPFFEKIIGKRIEDAVGDRQQDITQLPVGEVEELRKRLLYSALRTSEGQYRFEQAMGEKKAIEKQRKAINDSKSPAVKWRESQEDRIVVSKLAARDKRFSADVYGSIVTYIGD